MKTRPIAFSGGPMDHAEPRRSPAEIAGFRADPNAKILMFSAGNPAVTSEGALHYFTIDALDTSTLADPGLIFLGLDDGLPLFAAQRSTEGPEDPDFIQFENLRGIASRLSPKDLAITGRAKSLLDWHNAHRFCSKCGAASAPTLGGIKRICQTCDGEHFPRVNPVAIMLVLHGDQCLLGRGHGWPEGAFSTLAGFVSPGETLEEACIREVWEEVGVKPHSVRYMMSQPWPFPSQLMMGLSCHVDTMDITVNTAEIETAQWFSRDQIAAVFAKESDLFLRPPSFTIAHQLLRQWLGT